MRPLILPGSLSIALVTLAAANASAAVTTFTNLASWQAAAGAATLEDFSTSPAGILPAGSTDIGAFSIFLDKNNSGDNRIANARFEGYVDDPTQTLDLGALVLRFDFDTPLIGFAGDWLSTISGDRLTVTVAGTTIQFDSFLVGGNGFLGVVSTTPFTSLTFGLELFSGTTDGEGFALDNVRLASGATAVPAPSALALFSVGLLALGCRRQRP